VARDGSLAFDLLVSPNATSDLTIDQSIDIATLASGSQFQLKIRCIWPQAAMTPEVEDFPHLKTPRPPSQTKEMEHLVHLTWPASRPTDEAVIVEAARDADGAEWFPIHIYPSTSTEGVIAQQLWFSPLSTYSGPLKFRIVPVRFSPP
jgi:hypothetical protein